MMTKQNNTAALPDEQLEGIAGGRDVGPVSDGVRMRLGFRSVQPLPSPSPRIGLKGNYVGVVGEDGPVW